MNNLFDNQIFGVLISIVAFMIGSFIYKKTKITFLNPILISLFIIITFLKIFNIPLDNYKKGGDMIYFFLGPSTVILAIPLYKQIKLLKKHFKAILIGIISGTFSSCLSVIIISKFLNLDQNIIISLLPKSITTPIGIELSKTIGGNSAITIVSIVITGMAGAVLAPPVCKIFKIENSVAKGIAIGVSAHALGTSKAVEMGETEGAMSSLAIGLTGLSTVFIVPIIIKIFF